MSSTGNVGDAAVKLFFVETFSKDSPDYEKNVFKVLGEVLEILDQFSSSPMESNQESSSQQCNAATIIAMKIRAHTLRLSNWNGNIEKLPMIRSSYAELGKLGYTLNNEELYVVNEKLKTSLNQTIHCLSGIIKDLNVKGKRKFHVCS
ncbi:unnamed protein product [Rotaria sordida]|uniref:Uncharacterized protein n=1 Tax=Rotaria sordida TaxID=392033 RepID=A0A815CBH2_9BILA|nr:unnamed protein product [Rotaria sordida]